jgi:protease PrsW
MAMNHLNQLTRLLLALALAVVFLPLFPAEKAFAQEESMIGDVELAEMYAPVLYFHPDEIFRPQPVDVLVNTARLRRTRPAWFDVNVRSRLGVSDLCDYRDRRYVLDAWYGNAGASDYMNYTAHRRYYEAVLSPQAGGPPIVTYAHVVRDEKHPFVTIQYWLFYYYNDWVNKHEGDWEMVQVMLGEASEPQWVVLSQHHGGSRRSWSTTQVENGTHPVAYVALGSHANYFWGDEDYPNGKGVGNTRFEVMDRTGLSGRTEPEVVLLPNREDVEREPDTAPADVRWLLFEGYWGEHATHSDFSGPLGPADNGEKWQAPYDWGMAQSLDVDAWYTNRLRVAVTGKAAGDARVVLRAADGSSLALSETSGNVSLLHADLEPGASVIADVEVSPWATIDLVVTWPDVEAFRVTRYRFDRVPISTSGRASLRLEAGRVPVLILVDGQEVTYSEIEVEPVTWDVPDPVWSMGALPASDVVVGLMTSLLAGILPTLAYVGVLYWADRYEKEPAGLLSAAFFWGAVPALLGAVAVRLFFRLPVELFGQGAIEAVRAGLLVPLAVEALKGLVVLFLALRYRHEFDNVLDGVVYGAMVGFGFAMTQNTMSYLGAFALLGFAGLSTTIFVEGIVYGLNHALYTAFLGAGLGYARSARQRWQRWAIPLGSFVLAVVSHAVHNLAIQNAVGLNLLTVSVPWAEGMVIVVIIIWSLRRQRRCLRTELVGEVPDTLYLGLTTGSNRQRVLWQALRQDGVGGWRRTRYLRQLCAELAFKKAQYRQWPGETKALEQIECLRREIGKRLEDGKRSSLVISDKRLADAFTKDESLFLHALEYHDRGGFAYVEVGDGDELWQNQSFGTVRRAHPRVFDWMHKLNRQGRLHWVLGK